MDCEADHLISRALLLVQSTEQFIDLGRLQEFDLSLVETRKAIFEAIGCTPSSSPGWLMLFWEASLSGTQDGLMFAYLQRCYDLGANEGWLALLRFQLMGKLFDGLPQGLRNAMVAEFSGLVRSGFIVEAAKVYTVSSVRAQLVLDLAIEGLPGHAARGIKGAVQQLQSIPLIDALGGSRPELRPQSTR